MSQKPDIPAILSELSASCPAGYAIALHIRYSAPRFLFQTYASDWKETYSANGFVLKDPTVQWGFANTGTIRWDALRAEDAAGVLSLAAEYGLKHGFTVAVARGETRSIASFARRDGDFSDAEIAQVAETVRQLHDYTAGLDRISAAERDTLRKLSVAFTHG